jgi:DNA-binding transcriptional ArsR family regulator
VSTTAEQANRLFHALSDATRRDIVTRTLLNEYSVSSLARHYPMSFAAVQKHVAVLADAGLVTKRPSGRQQLVSGRVGTVHAAIALLNNYEALWRGRIERIADILSDPTTTTKATTSKSRKDLT